MEIELQKLTSKNTFYLDKTAAGIRFLSVGFTCLKATMKFTNLLIVMTALVLSSCSRDNRLDNYYHIVDSADKVIIYAKTVDNFSIKNYRFFRSAEKYEEYFKKAYQTRNSKNFYPNE